MNDAPRGTDNLDEATGARDRRAMLIAGLAGAVVAIAGASRGTAAENDCTGA